MSKETQEIDKVAFSIAVKTTAQAVKIILEPYCSKIEVVGSIRRKKENPNDVDIVLIPKEKDPIAVSMSSLGTRDSGGDKKEAWLIGAVKVELYYATEETWGAFVLMYTGSKMFNISMRVKAKKMGYTLNQYGLFEPTDAGTTIIASTTEESIFKALEMEYVKPEDR